MSLHRLRSKKRLQFINLEMIKGRDLKLLAKRKARNLDLVIMNNALNSAKNVNRSLLEEKEERNKEIIVLDQDNMILTVDRAKIEGLHLG